MTAEAACVRAARLVGTLPDAGPWRMSVFRDRVYCASESSGRLFAVDYEGMRELSPVPPLLMNEPASIMPGMLTLCRKP